jgi:hypothetical protein
MNATDTVNAQELGIKYYRSFISYEIPLQPEGEIPFEETEGLRSFYIGYHGKEGRVLQFVKILLVREEVRSVELSEKEDPGARVFFRVIRDPESRKAILGERLPYAKTEKITELFEGVVGDNGRDCQVTLYRKEQALKDMYIYWPNGNLKERILQRRDDHKSVWHYDQDGNLLEPVATPETPSPEHQSLP